MAETLSKTNNGSLQRVFLIDDHSMLLDGLALLVDQTPGCMVCGKAATAAEALAEIPTALPDLVVTDLSLPDKDGLELIKELNSLMPEVAILVFSMHDETLYAARTIEAGAKGYLMKGADITLLMDAVNRVLDGEVYLSPQIADRL